MTMSLRSIEIDVWRNKCPYEIAFNIKRSAHTIVDIGGKSWTTKQGWHIGLAWPAKSMCVQNFSRYWF